MNNTFDSCVISSLKASIAAKKARENKLQNDTDEKVEKDEEPSIYEECACNFINELDDFVKYTIAKCLDKNKYNIIRNETFARDNKFYTIHEETCVNGNIFPIVKSKECLDLDLNNFDPDDFICEFSTRIRKDSRFTNKCEQLFSETGIVLDFVNKTGKYDSDKCPKHILKFEPLPLLSFYAIIQ
jgi:hypothetical protein